MTQKRRRLWIVLASGLAAATAVTLVMMAFNDSIVFFVTPADLAEKGASGRQVRLGGLVEVGSVGHASNQSVVTTFRITDGVHSVPVSFKGVLPDLFREGQGVVTLGALKPDGTFIASDVLAKHDETYMPKDVAEALKKTGQWQPAKGPPPPAALWDAPLSKGVGG